MARDPYPLQWPEGWDRTPLDERGRAKFTTSLIRAAMIVRDEVNRIGGANVAITTNQPTRRDGLPYSSAREPDDSGVAVWWVDENGHERVIACDRWRLIQDNMRAIGASLEAMRGLERWGAGQVAQRARASFTALPAGDSAAPSDDPVHRARPWRDVLGGFPAGLGPTDLLVLARGRHRQLMLTAHPDRGGSATAAAEINAAIAAAEQELG